MNACTREGEETAACLGKGEDCGNSHSLNYGETTPKAQDPILFISCPSRDFQADSAANLFLTTFLFLSALIVLVPVVM